LVAFGVPARLACLAGLVRWYEVSDGGGLTAEGRSRREQVRLQAAKMFAEDADARQIARSLRESTKSVYQWRRAPGGPVATRPWRRRDRVGTLASWIRISWRGWARHWMPARPSTAGIPISGGR
jgi:hypothetical protein